MLPLFAVNNAYKYVRLTEDQIVEWETASDSEYYVNAKLLFTNKTDYHKPIWMDRWVEWFQHDIRKFTGKLWQHGRAAMVRRTVLNIRGMLNRKEDISGRRRRDAHANVDFAGLSEADDTRPFNRRNISDVMLYSVEYMQVGVSLI